MAVKDPFQFIEGLGVEPAPGADAFGELAPMQKKSPFFGVPPTQPEPPVQPLPDLPTGGQLPTGPTFEQRDALALIQSTLAEWGLPSTLADWAWGMILEGASNTQIVLELYRRPEFETRFAGMAQRVARGLPAMSVAEYLSNERAYQGVLRNAGLPSGFYDEPSDFAGWIGFDVSPVELQRRVQNVYAEISGSLPQVKEQFQSYYGVAPTDGDLLAYALDAQRGLDVIERQVRAAQLGGAAGVAGLSVGVQRAEQLAGLGVTQGQALEGYGQISSELSRQPWQVGAQGPALTQAELESEAFLGQAEITRRRQRRAAEARSLFDAGGGVATGQRGVSGLGEVLR